MDHDNLKACLGESFRAQGEKKALGFLREGRVETELSYGALDRDANRMAHTFTSMGVEKGDRVILYLPKSVAFVTAHIALQKIGAITVPLNPGFRRAEVAYMVGDTAPRLLLVGTEQEPVLQEVAPDIPRVLIPAERPYQELDFFRSSPDRPPGQETGPNDPALIIYTSGTTGDPKGAVLTQRNLARDAGHIIDIWEITASDVLCHALPLFHIHGLCFALHAALLAGSPVVMLDRFSPSDVLETLQKKEGEYACTVFMAVPAMYGRMMDVLGESIPDFAHIRLWTSGSAPLLPKDFERIERIFGKEPVEREGMSETGMNFSNPLRGRRKPGSIGLPLPEVEVRVVDPETRKDVPPGRPGEFWLKGPAISPGYWRKPEETSRAFDEGWFRTGDLGNVDEDGYYFLTDRIKHIIISGGENISPKEVESVINQIEDVVESCVVGVSDRAWGEKVVAAVVRRPGSTLEAQEVQAHCRGRLHKWKSPKEVLFVEELPKNRMGKVLRHEVQKRFCAEGGSLK